MRKMSSTLYCSYFLCLALAYCSCGVSAKRDITSRDAARQSPEPQRSSDLSEVTDINFPQPTYPEELKEAWRHFVEGGRYRMARPDEFSSTAQPHIDSYGGIYLPLLFDINRDHGYDDFAVIVVDTIRNDDARFGLVIFSAPEGKQRVFEASWVFRERDFSKMALSRASGRLVVTEYLDDGSQQSCFVRSDPHQRRYTCDQNKQRTLHREH